MSIRFETGQYENSHNTKPRGRGCWWFDIGADGAIGPRPWCASANLTYTEAKREAIAEARRVGCSVIKVLS
jgi:hypothetical protein